jgi:hypothetical protein
MRNYMASAMGGIFPLAQWEEIGRQNLAMFQRAAEMFTPPRHDESAPHPSQDTPARGLREPGAEASLDALRSEIEELRKRVNALSRAPED